MGIVAGGMLGMTAAVMAVPGYRGVVMRKAKTHGRKLLRAARHYLPHILG